MNDNIIADIVECMAINDDTGNIQTIQTEHRVKLVQFWDIKKGSRVLEIGCGQGDTTAALAYFVGEEGFVYGVDIAPPNYGSPITVSDAANHLKKSKLGRQIKMEFGIDILANDFDFTEETFDYIVFSHCSWYLKSFEELEDILKKVRKWGKKLCFAEWDSRIQTIEQYPHLLAVLIQSQYECFKESSLSNVRTLFTPTDVRRIVEKTSWTITIEQSINSPNLQDAKWEIDMTLDGYKEEISRLNNLPEKLKTLMQTEVILLDEARKSNKIKPMPTFVFVAE